MDQAQALRLQAQCNQGDAAEEAQPIVGKVFAELRAEIYRALEAENADPALLSMQLQAMRKVEDRLAAHIRGGQLALHELIK
jgi:hypothetical protein